MNRRGSRFRRRYRQCLEALVLATLACTVGAQAQTATPTVRLSVVSPPGRLVQPGTFATFTFGVSSSTLTTATVEVTSARGFRLLSPPPSVELPPGSVVPLAVTEEIPASASALSVDTLSLTITSGRATAEGTVRITVAAKSSLSLDAPAQATIESHEMAGAVVNAGNVTEDVTLEVSQADTTILQKSFAVAPASRVPITVPIAVEGAYSWTLSTAKGVVTRRLTEVTSQGVPEPPPLHLRGQLSAGVGSDATWNGDLTLRGPLSDYLTVDASLYGENLMASSLALSSDSWRVRVGALDRGPFSATLPQGFGVRAAIPLSETVGPGGDGSRTWLGATVSSLGGQTYAGYLDLANGIGSNNETAVAAGLDAGQPMVAVHLRRKAGTVEWVSDGSLLDGSVNASLNLSGRVPRADAIGTLGIRGTALNTVNGMLGFAASYSEAKATVYGSVDAPIGRDATWNAQGGMVVSLPSSVPGALHLALQGGTQQSYAALEYGVSFGGLQTTESIGATSTSLGFGWRLTSLLSYSAGPDNTIGFDADVSYVPSAGATLGRVDGHFARILGPATLAIDSNWDLTSHEIGLGASVSLQTGWLTTLASADGSYQLDTRYLGFDFRLTGSVPIDIVVPDSIVAAAGGRRFGTLRLHVHAGAQGISGIRIHVGPYVVHTGADGAAEARLRPGTVKIQIDLASLPIQYRLVGAQSLTRQIVAKESTSADFPVVVAAALKGRVLQDTNGDGVPDSPAVPIPATIVLTPAEGSPEVLTAGSDGAFEARGLVPGTATLGLAGLPLGASAEAPKPQTVTFQAGHVTDVTLLVRPAIASAKTFSSSSLRIRNVAVQVMHAPPGSAPLLTVEVQGDAQSVVASAVGKQIKLQRLLAAPAAAPPKTPTTSGGVSPDTAAGLTAVTRWVARLALPEDMKEGPVTVTVTARNGSRTSTRQAQLIVDKAAPFMSATSPAAVTPGGTAEIVVAVYSAVRSVSVTSPFRPSPVAATEAAPGTWTAHLAVPATATRGVYPARVSVRLESGQLVEGTVAVRVDIR